MRIKPPIILLSLIAACADAPTTEPAPLLPDDCVFIGPDVPWFEPGDTVDVWISVQPGLNPMDATGLSQAQFLNGVRQALNIWNEESGAALRLYIRGFTDHDRIDGAVVITGRSDVCDGAIAVAFPDVDSGGDWHSTTIEVRSNAGAACVPLSWTTMPTGGTDLAAVLLHELGHGVYNLAHPGDPTCADIGQRTVMRGAGSRVLGSADQELAQKRVGTRGRDARFQWTEMSGPTSWFPVSDAVGMDGIQPQFRPGSMSAGKEDIFFGWIQDVDGIAQRGGAGRADVNGWRFGNGSFNWHLQTAPDGALGRPVAVASSTFTGELLMAYQIAADNDDVYLTREGQICWRTSDDDGASWSPQTCEWDGLFGPLQARAGAYGLTATYDRHSDTFLVGYISNPDGTNGFDVSVLTIPTTSGLVKYPTFSTLGVSSVHAPALACRSDIECVAAFQQTDAFGTLGTVTFVVDSLTGEVASIGSVEGSLLPIYDTPALVYIADDDSYRMAYAVDSAAIYTHRKPAGGGAWAGTGDVFNDTNAHVSSPSLAMVPDGEGNTFPHAWFVRYW